MLDFHLPLLPKITKGDDDENKEQQFNLFNDNFLKKAARLLKGKYLKDNEENMYNLNINVWEKWFME